MKSPAECGDSFQSLQAYGERHTITDATLEERQTKADDLQEMQALGKKGGLARGC